MGPRSRRVSIQWPLPTSIYIMQNEILLYNTALDSSMPIKHYMSTRTNRPPAFTELVFILSHNVQPTMSFLLGPTYPPPSGLASSDDFRDITDSLARTLDSSLKSGQSSFGEFWGNSSSLSITAVSTQDGVDVPFLDYHFSSPYLNTSAGSIVKVTSSSVYRIGSISKLFTVYMLLVNYGWHCWDQSVTCHIPELRQASHGLGTNAVEHVDWDHVTIGSLASQLSGVGRDCMLKVERVLGWANAANRRQRRFVQPTSICSGLWATRTPLG